MNASKLAKRNTLDIFYLLLVVLAPIYIYVGLDDSFNPLIFLKGALEVIVGPFYPGFHLIYPPLLVAVLITLIGFSYSIVSRWKRMTLIFITLILWISLGLLSIISWYQ